MKGDAGTGEIVSAKSELSMATYKLTPEIDDGHCLLSCCAFGI